MEHIWELPDEKFYKINVHCVVSPVPLPNGNTNSVGVVVRNDTGEDVWKGMGPMPGLNEEQAIMAGIQAASIEGRKRKWDLIHIETTNRNVFETILMQQHMVLQENQREAYGLFNTIYANHHKDGKTDRCISCVPPHMNSTADYMANYGLNNLSVFSELEEDLGDMRYWLNRDMGMVLPAPLRETPLLLGGGEVVDGPPPPKILKRKRNPFAMEESALLPFFKPDTISWNLNPANYDPSGKYKKKLYEGSSFNKNGAFSDVAINILNDGTLHGLPDIFSSQVVDLDAPVDYGMYGRDLLHHAVNGTLQEFMRGSRMMGEMVKKRYILMDVDEVLEAMGMASRDVKMKNAASSSA
ncbi:hypothetical protein DCAR_0624143 [Daucus carota subsp. sativus]|uniref:Uncharacterized protein n=1 Tax=Daucus carota subsp. sativus TaxID=79200 RepID=A0A161YD34_DAUCS|nr:hypothetical protein DCAR_0624143 [Daucus carota subsp. sativus]